MIYAVIDTNVLVSALLTHNVGVATAKVLDSVAKCDIVCVYNEDILMEYREVLHRPKFKFPERKIDSLLAFITQKGIHSDRVPYDGNMPDEKDRPFYEVSLSVEDSFLVTGNLKHFPVTPKVVTPSQMIDIINNQSLYIKILLLPLHSLTTSRKWNKADQSFVPRQRLMFCPHSLTSESGQFTGL